MSETATRPELTKRELWLMQKAWDMACQTSQRANGFKTMDEWLLSRTGRDSVAKDGLELCAPRFGLEMIEKQDLIDAILDVRCRKIVEIIKGGGYTLDQIAKGLEFIGVVLRAQKADAVGNQS